jgi:hypothetical protein
MRDAGNRPYLPRPGKRGRLEDREQPLFLTHLQLPYADNGRAGGGQMKKAFNGMVARTCETLRRRALEDASALHRRGECEAARARWAEAASEIALLRQLTPHWFRHLLATTMMAAGDLEYTMNQGGWRDAPPVMGYSHDVPERRRAGCGAATAATLSFWHNFDTRRRDRGEKGKLNQAWAITARSVDIVEVTGSIPVAPTAFLSSAASVLTGWRSIRP